MIIAREDLGVGLGGLESGPSFYYLLTPTSAVADSGVFLCDHER